MAPKATHEEIRDYLFRCGDEGATIVSIAKHFSLSEEHARYRMREMLAHQWVTRRRAGEQRGDGHVYWHVYVVRTSALGKTWPRRPSKSGNRYDNRERVRDYLAHAPLKMRRVDDIAGALELKIQRVYALLAEMSKRGWVESETIGTPIEKNWCKLYTVVPTCLGKRWHAPEKGNERQEVDRADIGEAK